MGNTKHTKEQIRERIQQKKILFDGAFGTYYGGKYDTRQLPELANLEAPERVKEIHREYLEAGAQILRTNTFAANSFCMDIPREQIGETAQWAPAGKGSSGRVERYHRRDERDLHSGGHWPDSRGGHGTERCFKQRI